MIDIEPEKRKWSSMTCLRRGIDIAAKDDETRNLISKYEQYAPVRWINANGISDTPSPSTPLSSSSSSSNATVYNHAEDWQPGSEGAHDDMCAYDWIRSRMSGGVDWFYPKGTATHSVEQFVKSDGKAVLEPSPMYGNKLPGEARQFAPHMQQEMQYNVSPN
jgi:hypothetical protein